MIQSSLDSSGDRKMKNYQCHDSLSDTSSEGRGKKTKSSRVKGWQLFLESDSDGESSKYQGYCVIIICCDYLLPLLAIAEGFDDFLSSLPDAASSYLDMELDWDNDYDRDLIEIAKHMVEWETHLKSPFHLTRTDISDIKIEPRPELQRYYYVQKYHTSS